MRTKLFKTLIFIVVNLIAINTHGQYYKNLKQMNLRGNVKSIKEVTIEGYPKETNFYIFDKNGNISQWQSYYNMKLKNASNFVFDDKGLKIKEVVF